MLRAQYSILLFATWSICLIPHSNPWFQAATMDFELSMALLALWFASTASLFIAAAMFLHNSGVCMLPWPAMPDIRHTTHLAHTNKQTVLLSCHTHALLSPGEAFHPHSIVMDRRHKYFSVVVRHVMSYATFSFFRTASHDHIHIHIHPRSTHMTWFITAKGAKRFIRVGWWMWIDASKALLHLRLYDVHLLTYV